MDAMTMIVKRTFQDVQLTITILAQQPIIAIPRIVHAAVVVNVIDGERDIICQSRSRFLL
jgi:hypothetical protein